MDRPPIRTLVPLLIALTGSAVATTSLADEGREIMDRVQKLDRSERRWRDRTRRMEIVIHDRRGGTRTRDMEMRTLRDASHDEKILAVFQTPPEIRGTALLQFQYRDRDADQWLYLPELRRVRKITSSVKDESFMGTDFSFRDMELLTDTLEWTAEEANAQLLGEAEVEGRAAHRIQLTPTQRDIGYERIVVVLTADDLVLRSMEFYGVEAEPRKTLDLGRIEQIGAIPTPHEMVMRQPADGTHTVVEISNVRYDQGLDEDLFTKRSLERGLDLP